MKLKNKNILIFLSVGIVLIISIFFAFNKSHEYHELPKVKVKDKDKVKQFALMIEQTRGKGDYQESENELPTEGYKLNLNKSGCTDINGKLVENVLDYDYDNYSLILNTDKTVYCYLYYDIYTSAPGTQLEGESFLSKELIGGLYRYQGLYSDNIKNYICLGDNCCKTTECGADSNDDMYRIIGINASGEIKVIKRTSLINTMAMHSTNQTDTKWPDSDLFHNLNDYEEGSSFKDTSFYSTLDEKLKPYIIKKDWLYGDTSENYQYNGDFYYGIESGTMETKHKLKTTSGYEEVTYIWDKEKDKINAYIGLQYIHDYLYAYPKGNPENYNNASKSWIYLLNNDSNPPEGNNNIQGKEWTMTRYGFDPDYNCYSTYFISTVGSLVIHAHQWILSVRPVFYLSNNINLSGSGTLNDPFRIF